MANLAYGTGNSSYYDLCRQQRVFSALATVTTPTVYSTAAGTGGPLLWNNSGAGAQRVMAVILAVGCSITVAAAANASLGITGNSGQTAAPTTATAIDAIANMYIGGPLPQCNLYRKGTVANAGNFFMPTDIIPVAAGLTATPLATDWVPVEGSVIVPYGSWASIAAGSTATSAVCQIGLLWAEIPY